MNPVLTTLIVTIVALAVSALGGWPIVSGVLRHISKDRQLPSDTPANPTEEVPPTLRGGAYIGVLERLATTAAIIAGQPGLIAIVVAVKGFGRFDQLKGNPAASEKFTIGTLLSLLWAAAIGVAGAGLISIFT